MLKLSKMEVLQLIDYLKERIEENKSDLANARLTIKDVSTLEQLVFDDTTLESKGYKVIREEIVPILCYLDLSALSFSSVCLNGQISFADLSGTNANVDPQLVYNLDMRYGVFPLDFTGKSFNGVQVSNSNFAGSLGVRFYLSMLNGDLKDGIYPVEIINDIKEPNHKHICCDLSDFIGSTGDIDLFLHNQHKDEDDIKKQATSLYEKYNIRTPLSSSLGLDYNYKLAKFNHMKDKCNDSNNVIIAKIIIDNSINALQKVSTPSAAINF